MSRRKLPPKAILKAWKAEGLTYEDMADRLLEQTGEVVTPHSFGQAMYREGILTKPETTRHDDVIPFVLADRHKMKYVSKMLRLYGCVQKGVPAAEIERVPAWLKKNRDSGIVWWYVANSDDGWYPVKWHPLDGDNPVRHPDVQAKLDEIKLKEAAKERRDAV